MSQEEQNGPALYALLIGINHYPGKAAPDGAIYDSLNGCVPDVTRMERFLRERMKLDDQHLVKLTATERGIRLAEPPDKQPTRKNIIGAFNHLTETANAGDQVYIHYSGHGGRAETIYPDVKGAEGLDEGLVPMDVNSTDVDYVRDLEIAELLKRMVSKGLIVWMVLDSCHSGGATRGNPKARVRSARNGQIDRVKRSTDNLVASVDALQAAWRDKPKRRTRGTQPVSGWLPEPQGYVMLAACDPTQLAAEDEFEGEIQGALTYWLLDTLQRANGGMSYQQLYNRLLGKIGTQFASQTPLLEGEMSRAIFGSDRLATREAINVLDVDPETGQLKLAVGQSGLVNVGATLAIYPSGTRDFSDIHARQAIVKIVEIMGSESRAEIVERLNQTSPLDAGSQAVVLNFANLDLLRPVALVAQGRDPSPEEKAAFDAVTAAITAHQDKMKALGMASLVEIAPDGSAPKYQVSVTAKGEYEISDSVGAPYPNLVPALRTADPKAPEEVVKRLEHLARYHAISELDNWDQDSPLNNKLELRLYKPPENWQPGQRVKLEEWGDLGNAPTIGVGATYMLHLTNHSDKKMNFAILDLAPEWSVEQFYPKEESSAILEPGKSAYRILRPTLPTDVQQGTDILKVFATTEPGTFRWLEMLPLGRGARGTRSESATKTALDVLLQGINFPKTRGTEDVKTASEEWVSAQVQVNAVRR